MKKACVIGWPITHSRSPIIHNYWLKKYNIVGTYERISVEPENLKSFIDNLSRNGFVGCNVTIPHKETALSLVQNLDEIVVSTGSLNTIYLIGGEVHATSTDGEGFSKNLLSTLPNYSLRDKNIILIGAGGSAKAIIDNLLRQSVRHVKIFNRTVERAQQIKQQFGTRVKIGNPIPNQIDLEECDLLINTTPQGMDGQRPNDLDISSLPPTAIVADIVYVPLKTELIKRAESQGLRTVTGLGMLLHQAVRGFELWFGVRPAVTPELYELVARNINPDYEA